MLVVPRVANVSASDTVTRRVGGRFTRSQRLLRPQQFRRVFAESCRCHNRHFSFLTRKNELSVARLGITVAKRNVRLAVVRNRIKRQVRETFRQYQELYAGYDTVIMAKAGSGTLNRVQLQQALEDIWNRGHELCVKS